MDDIQKEVYEKEKLVKTKRQNNVNINITSRIEIDLTDDQSSSSFDSNGNLFFVLIFFFESILRDIVSKNLPSWNLGGQQIVSGPIFSDSPYKNRVVANFSALEDQFWPKFSTFSTRGVKIGQN